MATSILKHAWHFFSPLWLLGPIFDKELRVSSRRRRNYILRFAYIALLSTILFFVWVNQVQTSGYTLYEVSRMAQAGQTIISFLVWFQFCATQIIAVIMLSNSISDEIYNKTLGLLMTTPISSFQIVMGKLLSKLLQLFLLMVISIPLLSVVRIFGGIPWSYIISCLCITLVTVIFVGSLTLFLSIFSQKTYVVIIITIISLITIFAVIPLIASAVFELAGFDNIIPRDIFRSIVYQANPYYLLSLQTNNLLSQGSKNPAYFSWILNCGILTIASFIILMISMILVRKIALRQVTGQPISTKVKSNSKKYMSVDDDHSLKIRRVSDPPVVWKELRLPMLGKHKIVAGICIFLVLSLLLFTYWICAMERQLSDPNIHMLYIMIFFSLGVIFTIILTATGITTEKESRSWPILLTTTLEDRQILFGKYIGSIRKLLPVWILLFAHVIIFCLDGVINPVAVIQITILVAWTETFLFCTGIYFSSRHKHTTTAVIVNFVFCAIIWVLIPIVLFLLGTFLLNDDEFANAYMDTNPFLHAVVIVDANTNTSTNYQWVSFNTNALMSTAWMIVCMVGYMFIGTIFALLAKRRFRRNIF